MGFPKGISMRWQHHDKIDPDLLAMSIALHIAMWHEKPASMTYPGYMAPLEYTDAMI